MKLNIFVRLYTIPKQAKKSLYNNLILCNNHIYVSPCVFTVNLFVNKACAFHS